MSISGMQTVEQLPAARVSQRLEHLVDLFHRHVLTLERIGRSIPERVHYMQVCACMSSRGSVRCLTMGIRLMCLRRGANRCHVCMSLFNSGVVTERSRNVNWPVSFTSRAACRKPVMAAR